MCPADAPEEIDALKQQVSQAQREAGELNQMREEGTVLENEAAAADDWERAKELHDTNVSNDEAIAALKGKINSLADQIIDLMKGQ